MSNTSAVADLEIKGTPGETKAYQIIVNHVSEGGRERKRRFPALVGAYFVMLSLYWRSGRKPVNSIHLGDFVGIAPESASTILQSLWKAGVLCRFRPGNLIGGGFAYLPNNAKNRALADSLEGSERGTYDGTVRIKKDRLEALERVAEKFKGIDPEVLEQLASALVVAPPVAPTPTHEGVNA